MLLEIEGGLLVSFKGNASYNNISLISCIFTENQADFGAGVFLNFSDNTQYNTVKINTTDFTNNKCYEIDSERSTVSSAYHSIGGGLLVNDQQLVLHITALAVDC